MVTGCGGSWRTVTCPTTGNLRLQLKDGSNPWWIALQVRNHRRPVAKLEAWLTAQRADTHAWTHWSFINLMTLVMLCPECNLA